MPKKAVCIISGGLDSALATMMAKNMGYEIVALHFDYRQLTENKERECFFALASFYEAVKTIVLDLPFIATNAPSALTVAIDNGEKIATSDAAKNSAASVSATSDAAKTAAKSSLAESEIAKNFPPTYVPFRNGIFLSIATAIAYANGAEAIFIGAVEEDSSGYPDCSEEFLGAFERAGTIGSGAGIKIIAPLVHLSKAQIAASAINLGVPVNLTWSCYEREDAACGECESCRLRLKGFKLAGLTDPIKYAKK